MPTICITLQMWFAGKYYFVGNHTVQAISILASSLFLAVSACLLLPDVYHTYLVKRSEGIYNYLLISDSITSDHVYQLLAHGPTASSTTKTGRHEIAEILLKVALNTKIQIPFVLFFCWPLGCLSLFDLQILITPLISSNSFYM